MRHLISILLFFLLLRPLMAQEESPFPVLNAEDIFAEGVTVLERLPSLVSDDEQRRLHYFNPELELWQSADYPNDLEWIAMMSIIPYSDGTYLVSQYGLLWSIAEIDFLWLFNPFTGQFSRPSNSSEICGVYPVYDVMLYENPEFWIIDEANQTLCNIVTGENVALPQDRNWHTFYNAPFGGPQLITESNSGFVYLRGGYAYDIEAQAWRYVREPNIEDNPPIFLLNHLILFQYNNALYLADMRQENSLRLLAEGDFWGQAHLLSNDRLIFGYMRDYETVFSEYNLDTQQISEILVLPCLEERVVSYRCTPTNLWLHPIYPEILFYQGALSNFHALDMNTGEIILSGQTFLRWIGNRRFAVGQGNEFIYDYEISQGENTWSVNHLEWIAPQLSIYPSPISPDGKYILVDVSDGIATTQTQSIFDLYTRRELSINVVFAQAENQFLSLRWQTDNTIIVSISVEQAFSERYFYYNWRISIDALSGNNS